MEALAKQIARARRRLWLQQFLTTLSWSWFAGLLVAAIAVAAGKIWPPDTATFTWAGMWIAAGSLSGLLFALVWTMARAKSGLDAACEIDRRFGLKERVSTAMALSPAELNTDVGQAVLRDAELRVADVRVADKFGVTADRRAWLPLVPLAVALLVAFLVHGRVSETAVAASTTTAAAAQVKNSTKTLEKRLAEKREEAREKGLKDADELLKKVEDGTRKLAEQKQADPKQALLELNDLAKNLEQRREKLPSQDELKQHFNQLKDLEKGPADKFAQAMKNGDFKKAAAELKKLQDRLQNDKLNEDEKKQLAQQLDRMQQGLEKGAAAHQEALKKLQEQIAEQRQAGNDKEAERLQQKHDQLQKQSRQAQQMAQMGQKLAQAGQSLKQGDAKAASEALESLSQDVKSAQQASEEQAMLDEALDQLAEAKSSMGCKECQGGGCKACQGNGLKEGRPGPGL
jgi:hypothetical protein